MRYGICTDINYAGRVKKAGFDYIELKTYDVALADEKRFHQIGMQLRENEIACEAINFFYPPSLKVVGMGIDHSKIQWYIETAVARAGLLGVRIITVGSSVSRRIPDGFSEARARIQFGEQLRYAGELAGPLGITIAIEPIRPASTNFINTINEAVWLCRQVNHESVKVMADYYQMAGAGDSISELRKYSEDICHLHTIDINKKIYPLDPEDEGQNKLFQAYAKCKNGTRVSLEGADFTTVQTASKALAALKNYYRNAM